MVRFAALRLAGLRLAGVRFAAFRFVGVTLAVCRIPRRFVVPLAGLLAAARWAGRFFGRAARLAGLRPSGSCRPAGALGRVAEDYVRQFGNLARSTNTLVVPANLSDIASMIAMATKVFEQSRPPVVR